MKRCARYLNVQGQLQSGLEFKDSVGSPPIGVAVDLPPKVKNICPSGADQDAPGGILSIILVYTCHSNSHHWEYLSS